MCIYRKYVWSNYCLGYKQHALLDPSLSLHRLGIGPSSHLHFMPFKVKERKREREREEREERSIERIDRSHCSHGNTLEWLEEKWSTMNQTVRVVL
jgi:hypothetical protein